MLLHKYLYIAVDVNNRQRNEKPWKKYSLKCEYFVLKRISEHKLAVVITFLESFWKFSGLRYKAGNEFSLKSSVRMFFTAYKNVRQRVESTKYCIRTRFRKHNYRHIVFSTTLFTLRNNV